MDDGTPSEPGAKPASQSAAVGNASADPAALDSVGQFIKVARARIPEERIRGDIRVTPKGLFIHKDSLEIVMDCYQRWLHEVAPHAHDPGATRILKRMFGTVTPPLYYLIEPKRALVGHLIESPVQNPQQLGLPVYLGSLEDGTTRVHPRDPLLQCIPQLTVQQSPQGISCKLGLGKRTVSFTIELVQLFARLAAHNRELSAVLGQEKPALRDALRLLVERLSAAHVCPAQQRLLLPFRMQRERRVECLADGSLFWPVRENGSIDTMIDREGRNLFSFIRSEMGACARGAGPKTINIGSVGQFFAGGARGDAVGQFRFFGKSYALEPHALSQFVKSVLRTPPEPRTAPLAALPFNATATARPNDQRDIRPAGARASVRDWQRFSVLDCISEFGELFLQAEPVDAYRVERFVSPDRHAHYRMLGRWVFVVSGRDVITHCVDKLLGERAEGSAPRAGNHGRRPRAAGGGRGHGDRARRHGGRHRGRGAQTSAARAGEQRSGGPHSGAPSLGEGKKS